MLLRLVYLGLIQLFAAVRLFRRSSAEKDVEILVLRHQLAVLQRQHPRPKLRRADRVVLAALLHRTPRTHLRKLQLLVSPDTILRWQRDLLRRRWAAISKPKRHGRPPTRRRIQALVLRLARENSSWGYRRIHGELAGLGITLAPSTVWEILKAHGIEPAPRRTGPGWAEFLRGQAQAILAVDFFTARALNGATIYVLAVIEHASRRVRILGATKHPTGAWTAQQARNLRMNLADANVRMRYLIRDRDTKFDGAFDAIFAADGIRIIKSAVRAPRMNSIMARWIKSCRTELLDRTLIQNERHLLHLLREYEEHYNTHRTHRALHAAAPLRALNRPRFLAASLWAAPGGAQGEVSFAGVFCQVAPRSSSTVIKVPQSGHWPPGPRRVEKVLQSSQRWVPRERVWQLGQA